MRRLILVLALVAGCAAPAPHPYPEKAQAAFHKTCPTSDPRCACAWDKITRAMTYEDYQAAMEKLASDGIMDHKLTVARTECLEAK